jgi:hypothetical protein
VTGSTLKRTLRRLAVNMVIAAFGYLVIGIWSFGHLVIWSFECSIDVLTEARITPARARRKGVSSGP